MKIEVQKHKINVDTHLKLIGDAKLSLAHNSGRSLCVASSYRQSKLIKRILE